MTGAVAIPVPLHRPLPPEEAARADFYALLARLFHLPPGQDLLAQLAAAPPLPASGDFALAKAWSGLAAASSVMDADAAALEHETLFTGIGKAPVSIYAGFYAGSPAIDHPRVRIQRDLAQLGLGRRPDVSEPEDHLPGLFDVMRVLVAGGAGREPASLAEQKRFYHAHLEPAAPPFFNAVCEAAQANYYRHVAAVGAAFIALESESFLLD